MAEAGHSARDPVIPPGAVTEIPPYRREAVIVRSAPAETGLQRAGYATAIPPHVSICIVTHNALPYVRRCLESIRAVTPVPHELVVVDNASRAETREWLATQPDLNLALNDDNRLWCAGINQAMAMTDPRSRALLLLNPDVEILCDRWLEVLLRPLDSDPRVAVVGTTHRYSPLGPVHGWVDGCCFLVRRQAVEEVGSFDADRFPWSGGPALWTIRAWKAGWTYRVVNRRDRLLLHHQHRSIEDQDPTARRPHEAFRMPLSFEAMLREEGIESRPAPWPRRLLDRRFRAVRDRGRFYATPPAAAGSYRAAPGAAAGGR